MAWPKGRPNPHGGNRKGIKNKTTSAQQQFRAAVASSGLMPLDFMLQQLRDETKPDAERMHAAATAAPYLHARLTAIDAKVSGDLTVTIKHYANGERRAA